MCKISWKMYEVYLKFVVVFGVVLEWRDIVGLGV